MTDLTFDPRTILIIFKAFMIFALVGNLFIFLMPDAYAKLNELFMKEYGFKKRLLPWLETERITIDAWVLKKRGIFGILFIGISFLLLISVR